METIFLKPLTNKNGDICYGKYTLWFNTNGIRIYTNIFMYYCIRIIKQKQLTREVYSEF